MRCVKRKVFSELDVICAEFGESLQKKCRAQRSALSESPGYLAGCVNLTDDSRAARRKSGLLGIKIVREFVTEQQSKQHRAEVVSERKTGRCDGFV